MAAAPRENPVRMFSSGTIAATIFYSKWLVTVVSYHFYLNMHVLTHIDLQKLLLLLMWRRRHHHGVLNVAACHLNRNSSLYGVRIKEKVQQHIKRAQY